MFRLSLHIGPLHLDVAIGDSPEVVEETTPYDKTYLPMPLEEGCVNAFEEMSEQYVEEWDE